jgi:hypothetical protein
MNESFEDQLRRALRPVDAPQGLAERVLAALPERRAATVTSIAAARPPASRPRHRYLMPAALAASLLCAVFVGQKVATQLEERAQQAQRIAEERGREASRELMQALRITSQKLDRAYEAMQEPPAPGAEENPT